MAKKTLRVKLGKSKIFRNLSVFTEIFENLEKKPIEKTCNVPTNWRKVMNIPLNDNTFK